MGQKKILFTSNLAGKNGVDGFSTASISASKALQCLFHLALNIEKVSPETKAQNEEQYGVELHHLDIDRNPFHWKNIKAFKQLTALIQAEKYDMIHCNTPTGGLLGRLAGKKCGVKKVIYQAHGFHFYKGAPKKNWLLYYTAERWLAHYTDAIVTMNQEDYEAAKKFKQKKGGKVYFVHGVGIDLQEYEGLSSLRPQKRQELGLSDDDIMLISMGDLIPRKNYGTAIRAVAKAGDPRLRYMICGRGPEQENLQQLAKELGIENQIHFLGYRTDVKELLTAADIFLFTTLQEGLPRSMMEAMASGLPCVASKIRGNVDLIEEGKGGFLCEPTDDEGFARAIRTIAQNPDLLSQMRAYNLERIKDFDISMVEKEIRDIYAEVLT